jgi:hypothetical protein
MEIEVHQRGGVLGLDRRYLIKNGTIEVIDKGRSRGSKDLDPAQAAKIDELTKHAAGSVSPRAAGLLPSDGMQTAIAILGDTGTKSVLEVSTGDEAPAVVWDLIGEVSRASGA